MNLIGLLAEELARMQDYKPGERVDGRPAMLVDVLFAYRLMLGRWPEFNTVEQFRARLGVRTLESFSLEFARSAEFKTRFSDDSGYDLDIMTELPGGLRLWFNWRDRQAIRIATGMHEATTQQAVRRVLRPGMNCLDLGAHIGLYTLIMAQASGPTGKVYAFEPFPAVHDLLVKNVEENRFGDSVMVFRVACGARRGKARIFVPLADDLGPTFVPVRPDVEVARGLDSVEIELACADSLVPEDRRIGLIKMDIEGGEPRALRGMQRIVGRDRPVIVTEFSPDCLIRIDESDPADYLRQLRDLGYRVYEDVDFLAASGREFVYAGGSQTVNLVCVPMDESPLAAENAFHTGLRKERTLTSGASPGPESRAKLTGTRAPMGKGSKGESWTARNSPPAFCPASPSHAYFERRYESSPLIQSSRIGENSSMMTVSSRASLLCGTSGGTWTISPALSTNSSSPTVIRTAPFSTMVT
jgi:FkbM family methyltransferase